mgnify:FL=1
MRLRPARALLRWCTDYVLHFAVECTAQRSGGLRRSRRKKSSRHCAAQGASASIPAQGEQQRI